MKVLFYGHFRYNGRFIFFIDVCYSRFHRVYLLIINHYFTSTQMAHNTFLITSNFVYNFEILLPLLFFSKLVP